VKTRTLLFGLLFALGVVFVATGPAHAGPTYLVTAQKADMSQSFGCAFVEVVSGDTYKYKCNNMGGLRAPAGESSAQLPPPAGFRLAVTGGTYPPTGGSYTCVFTGKNWDSGAFDQTSHHKVSVKYGDPAEACSVDQENENTWFAGMDTNYGHKYKPHKNTDPATKRNSGF
jgi:hypothetical protein